MNGDIFIPAGIISINSDPFHRSHSVFGMGTIEAPKYSAKEIAESNFVHDESGKVLD